MLPTVLRRWLWHYSYFVWLYVFNYGTSCWVGGSGFQWCLCPPTPASGSLDLFSFVFWFCVVAVIRRSEFSSVPGCSVVSFIWFFCFLMLDLIWTAAVAVNACILLMCVCMVPWMEVVGTLGRCNMSHVMRKPVFAICKQQRRRSACS